MPRLMGVSLTEPQVRARSKTVTRRLGWAFLESGEPLTLCRKVQGRRRADGTVEPLVRVAEVEVVSVRREPLNTITAEDVVREGFPEMTPAEFVAFFCEHMRCKPDTWVTRIEFRYLDAGPNGAADIGQTKDASGSNASGRLRLDGVTSDGRGSA